MTQHTPSGDAHRRDDTDLQRLPLSDLSLFCANELQVYTQGGTPNDLYPAELFRRAVVLRDSFAWGCIYRQYAPFVLPALMQHPQARVLLDQQEPAALLDAVLSTFAAELSEAKLARLNSQALLLKYLRVCVHTTVSRANRDQQLIARLAQLSAETAPGRPTLAHLGSPQADAQELWLAILGELNGEGERLLFTLLFVQGYSALEVCTHHRDRFPDTQAIYQVKAQIFERLRISECLQAMLGPQ